MKQTVTVLGARGSMPVSGERFARRGGGTICIFLRLNGQPVVLDAGTGMLELPGVLRPEEREIPLLLSHPHVDHLLGLPMCPTVSEASRRFHIYAAARMGLGTREQVRALLSPPLWPVGPEELAARLEFHELGNQLSLGPVTVETMEGVHPGGVTLMRLTGGGKRVVFATDCTLTEELLPKLTEFARNCDLLLVDGQYSAAEWPARKTFGHSTWVGAAHLGALCGAKQMRVIHHDPARTDRELDEAASELTAIHPACAFACAGEEIDL